MVGQYETFTTPPELGLCGAGGTQTHDLTDPRSADLPPSVRSTGDVLSLLRPCAELRQAVLRSVVIGHKRGRDLAG